MVLMIVPRLMKSLKVVAKDKYGTDYNGSELEKIYAQYKANKK